MKRKNTGRLRGLGRTIATAATAAGEDDLQYPRGFASGELPTFMQKQFPWGTGNPKAISSPHEAVEMRMPQAGSAIMHGNGLE